MFLALLFARSTVYKKAQHSLTAADSVAHQKQKAQQSRMQGKTLPQQIN